MTSTPARPRTRRRAAIWITVLVLVALVIGFFIFASLYTDILWFNQLGYLHVLTTQWFAAAALFGIGFFGMAIPLWITLNLAYRLRPVYAKLSSQLDRYQEVIEPLRRLAMWGVPIVFGLFAGSAASSNWQTALMWVNGTSAGTTDPQFGLDVSFYLFDLPFWHSVVGFASAVVLISFLALAATSYLYGSVRISGREVHIAKAARVQIAVTAALYLLLQAVSIWLDRFETMTSSNLDGKINGPGYTDVHASIPSKSILAGIAIVVALLFLMTAIIGHWRYPVVGTALLIVSALVIGAIYPWGVQTLKVEPSAKSIEKPYIEKAIDMTRQAYGISDVKEIPYEATTDAESGALRKDAQTTANIRILDPAVVSDAFGQLQQFKQYYDFADQLSVDRYPIDGKEQDTVVGVRELKLSGLTDSTKYNNTFVYTHGYGLVAAYGNERSADGQPVFLESGIPSRGELGDFQPRIYFGQSSPAYSVVGGPKDGKSIELDYPGGDDGARLTYNTFQGDGGPKLSNLFNRLVYTLKFQDEQFILSDAVNDDSQVLYDRDPIERVHKVAPYLKIDSSPYPSVVDGHVKWMIDGYTTSARYPYSQQISMTNAIIDSDTNVRSFGLDKINYIRNSVKATVDAYDGSVTLYAWNADDPILKTWEKIFPGTVKPMSEMSSELLSHVRYPQDLFKVQRDVLGQYHVTDPGSFYSRDDAWVTPPDPDSSKNSTTVQPPYYLTLQMPGQDEPTFSLYSTYIPRATKESSRNILRGYLAVDADAGDTPGTIADGYGKLRMLVLPDQDTVPGPGQVQANFTADTTVSTYLNLLRQGKTQVISGNLLTLPVGGGLLYVQPVYIKSTGETSYPLLQKVLVAFGDKIAFEDTLDKALDTLFGGDSGAEAGDTDVPDSDEDVIIDDEGVAHLPGEIPEGSTGGENEGSSDGSTGETPSEQPSEEPTEEPSDEPSTGSDLDKALHEAKKALADRDQAMKDGDWSAYGNADKRLTDAIARALELEQKEG